MELKNLFYKDIRKRYVTRLLYQQFGQA